MAKTLTAAGTIGAALVLTAAMFACGGRTETIIGGDGGSSSGGSGGSGGNGSGSGGSSGGLPNGPSCNGAFDTCWNCLVNACPSAFSCYETDCSAFLQCYCACPQGDRNCQNGCSSQQTAACTSCQSQGSSALKTCPGIQGCLSQCSSLGMSSGGGGSSGGSGGFGSSTGGGSGGFGSSSSGGGSSSTCSGSGGGPQCGNGEPLEFCQNFTGSTCTEAYYQVGSNSVFICASCTDTERAQKSALACLPVAALAPTPTPRGGVPSLICQRWDGTGGSRVRPLSTGPNAPVRALRHHRRRRPDLPGPAGPFRGPDADPQAGPLRPDAQALRGAREAHRRGQAPGPQDRREVRVRAHEVRGRDGQGPRRGQRRARPASAPRAVKQEQEILAAVRAATAKTLDEGKRAAQAEAERARAALKSEAAAMARDLASRVLGREVQS